jgi:predicted transcriptional regulator
LEKQEKGRRFKYNKKIKVMIQLTQLEAQVLKSLINGLYAEAGFSDVDAKDIAEWINTPIKSVRGAVGSLVKKGIIQIDETDNFGEEQFQIIYLNSNHYYLHPEWKNEREWNANEILVDLNNINNKQTKIKVMNTNETTTATSVKRGRPVSATSARQARLAVWEAKRSSGLEVKRGRPAKAKVVGAINPKKK